MSRYPVQYESSSKGLVNIEDMATPHLMNAWRKLQGAGPDSLELAIYMGLELQERGCVLDKETNRWSLPPKPEEASA